MPTYEFTCPAGHQFEKFYRKISDAVAELPCPACGQLATRKVSGGAGLVFKGSGFYITDYGKDGRKGETPAGKTADTGVGESKSDSTSNTPPAKTETTPKKEPSTPAKKSSSTE
jgi:putative FmdB family regulatory protein